MELVKKHAILTALAIVVGIGLVLWLQPTTSGGTMLVMTLSFVIFNAVGALRKRR
jgi:hypothetical protein